jgi:hypothetical protein
MVSETATVRQEQIDIIKCLLEKQWKELDYRRERENKLAAWSMVLLGGAAAWVTAKSGGSVSETIKHTFSIAATGLSTLFGLFLIENRKRYEKTQQILARQEEALRVWDSKYWQGTWPRKDTSLGDTLLPRTWLGWGNFGDQIMPRLDTITHVVAVWITAAAGTLVVHGDEWLAGVPYVLIPPITFGIWLRLLRLWSKAMGDKQGWWSEASLRRSLVLASIFVCGGLWFLPIYLLIGNAITSWYEDLRAVRADIHIWILALWGFIQLTILIPLFEYTRDFRRWQRSPGALDSRPAIISDDRSTRGYCPGGQRKGEGDGR